MSTDTQAPQQFLGCRFCGTDLDPLKKQVIAEIKKDGNISRACRDVGIVRNRFYPWTRKDSAFSEAVEAAIIEGKADKATLSRPTIKI